jgi:hypothetical protein
VRYGFGGRGVCVSVLTLAAAHESSWDKIHADLRISVLKSIALRGRDALFFFFNNIVSKKLKNGQ